MDPLLAGGLGRGSRLEGDQRSSQGRDTRARGGGTYFSTPRPVYELYDLQEDPSEYRNLWDDPESQDLKRNLLLQFLHGEMAKAPLPMPRIAGA